MPHTPGPWSIDRRGYITAPWPEDVDRPPGSPHQYPITVALIGDGLGHLSEREKADARLIIAALELLAACEAVPLTSSGVYPTEWYDRFRDWWETIAKPAIAKAKPQK